MYVILQGNPPESLHLYYAATGLSYYIPRSILYIIPLKEPARRLSLLKQGVIIFIFHIVSYAFILIVESSLNAMV